MTLDSYVWPAPAVIAQIVSGEAVLMLPARGEVKVLNSIGSRIWELCGGQRRLRDIVGVIVAEYAVDQASAEQDLLIFVADLAARGLLVVAPQPRATP